MSRRLNAFAAALAAAAILVGSAAPALAFKDEGLASSENHVPVAIDAVLLRPMGLLLTAGGAVLAVIPTAFVALTRPTDIVKPLDFFIGEPFRYTFMDPLGQHAPKGMFD